MDYLLKDEITEKTGTASLGLGEKISQKVMTDNNKRRLKKILKIIGIILAVILAVDIVSMILYFTLCGTPQ